MLLHYNPTNETSGPASSAKKIAEPLAWKTSNGKVSMNKTNLNCTVQDHVAELVTATRAAYLDGTYSGHRHGYDEGYVHGFSEGLRSSISYQQGARDGYMDGYQDGRADQRYIQGKAAA